MRGSTKKSPSQIQKFNSLKTKESQLPKWKSFQTLFIMVNKSFTQQSKGKDNLIRHLFKPFKDTISKTNACFRQHHDFFKETFSKDSVIVINTQNHTTRQNSWSYVTIRELQARNHNQISAITRLLRKTRFRKDEHFMISKLRYLSFLETKVCFKTLNLWKQPKGHEISKIVKKEVTGH